jgi:hypothetical protein
MAILANEKVLTLDYWKPARKLQVGDYVFDRRGNIVQVKLIQEYHAEDCYQVTFDDYLSVAGDAHLGFAVETPKYRQRLVDYKGRFKFTRPLKPMRVQDLQEVQLKTPKDRLAFSVPTTDPIKLPHQDLPVPPFILGLWFFSRRSTKTMAAARGRHDQVTQKFEDYGYKARFGRLLTTGEREFTLKPSVESQLAPNIPYKIPNNYLLASEEQRLELLQGIFCAKSRSYSQATDTFRFSDQHYPTVLQIQGLVESLGIRTKVVHAQNAKSYTLIFRTRHRLVDNQVSPPPKVHHGRRYIKEITKISGQQCVYIETTAPDNTILVGEGFISTC